MKYCSAPLLAMVILAAAPCAGVEAFAQSGSGPPTGGRTITRPIDQTPPGSGTSHDALRARVRAAGTIRVIAGLRTTVTTDRDGPRLRRMQDAVTRRVFGAAGGRVDRFAAIPFMSMFVNAGQLERLLADPDVTSVSEDVPAQPQTSSPQ